MVYLNENYKEATRLRKKGLSYSEILEKIPVAKSTLSLWLKSIGLSKKQKQRLTDKKLASALRGAARKKEIRIQNTQIIFQEAAKDIKNVSQRELFLIGVALYWAEGSKQKDHSISNRVRFSNSDPKMIKLFLLWLDKICGINFPNIRCDLYIHEEADIVNAKSFWEKEINMPIRGIYYKKSKITKRKNIGDNYFGLVSINVKQSTNLNRKISGWIDGICNYWGIV
ncbi:hypothetical protein HZB06_02740 [Candidatus Wolfebacteria bacterium]|nr:hypothetical protein [Candidatus Wolfebacteria bacterium]